MDLSRINDHKTSIQEFRHIRTHVGRLASGDITVDEFSDNTSNLDCLQDLNKNGICDSLESQGSVPDIVFTNVGRNYRVILNNLKLSNKNPIIPIVLNQTYTLRNHATGHPGPGLATAAEGCLRVV